jgi:hypothetical protein
MRAGGQLETEVPSALTPTRMPEPQPLKGAQEQSADRADSGRSLEPGRLPQPIINIPEGSRGRQPEGPARPAPRVGPPAAVTPDRLTEAAGEHQPSPVARRPAMVSPTDGGDDSREPLRPPQVHDLTAPAPEPRLNEHVMPLRVELPSVDSPATRAPRGEELAHPSEPISVISPPPPRDRLLPAPSAPRTAAEPVIEVTIGRVEVRSQPVARAAPRPSMPRPGVLSLSDYLAQRRGAR